MSLESIDPATRIGAVHLVVRDLRAALAFYQQRVGLHLLNDHGGAAALSAGDTTLLVLAEDRAALTTPRGPGLYHFALLLPSRAHLADALRRLARSGTALQGASDHGVSEALYLADPEGNGIELYADRPRDSWPRRNGQLSMGTTRLDVDGLLAEPEMSLTALPAETTVGHVHLQVSDLAASEHFYCTVLGFELMQRYGDAASFVSAGGYHHHIGFNTWHSLGAAPRPADAAGLRHVEVQLPDGVARERALARLRQSGVPVVDAAPDSLVRDPSGNALVLTLRPS